MRSEISYCGQGAEPWLYATPQALRGEAGNVDAFGEWVAGLANWNWFVTRTLGDQSLTEGFTSPGVGTARRCLRDLLVYTQARQFVCVFELQKRGVPHLHALLGGCRGLNGGRAHERDRRLWGISKWLVFREAGGAPAYLGKYLGKEAIELYIGLNGPYSNNGLRGPTLGGLRA